MATIQDHVDVQIKLQNKIVDPQAFNLNSLFTDDVRVPVDQRFKLVTKTSYTTDLGTDGVGQILNAYATTFFGQELTPDELMFARWIKTNTAPFFAWGGGYESDYLIWKAINDGEFEFKDSSANIDIVSGIDFSAITSFDQILTVIQAKLAAIGAPNIADLDSAVLEVDGANRITVKMLTAGATEPTVEITVVTTPTGTDLSTLIDLPNSKIVAGFDAETPVEAIEAVRAVKDDYYNFHFRGIDNAQIETVAVHTEAMEKFYDYVSADANIIDPAVTIDIFSTLKALSLLRTMQIYHEPTDEFPDAAIASRLLSTPEGKVNWAWTVVSLITDSGATNPLSATARSAIIAKGGNYFQNIKGFVTMYDGAVVQGEEKRIIVGRDWFAARLREARFNALLNDDLQAFDNPTLADAESDVLTIAAEAFARNILDNTAERPFTTNFPDADTIPASVRATRKMTINEAFHGYIKSAVNDWEIIGSWQL